MRLRPKALRATSASVIVALSDSTLLVGCTIDSPSTNGPRATLLPQNQMLQITVGLLLRKSPGLIHRTSSRLRLRIFPTTRALV